VDELTLTEWEKIFQKFDQKLYWLILSGGEPFLRPDLAALCQIGYKYTKPEVINIPTNGFLFDVIPSAVEKILESCPKSHLVINFSLDGIGEKHDQIRNLKDSFERLLKSYRALQKIKNPRLTLGIHSVISKLNHADIPEIYEYAMKELQPESYITEIAEKRKELDNFDLNVFPEYEEYSAAADFLIAKMKKQKFKGFSKVTRALRINYYQLVKEIIRQKKQVLPCYASWASGQISAEGEVWSCCVRAESMGNLRDNDYNFKKIWLSAEADKMRQSIKNKECYCPLASASYTNMLMHSPTLFKITKELMQ
jgi:MoaA/NifB/PqqE/SkfB family radical SAM enzyme